MSSVVANAGTQDGPIADPHAILASGPMTARQWVAVALSVLFDTDYTDLLADSVRPMVDPEKGVYEGFFEQGNGRVNSLTANTNGIVLLLGFSLLGMVSFYWLTVLEPRLRREAELQADLLAHSQASLVAVCDGRLFARA